MKYEEIIKLLDAGYTREEILNMKETPAPEPAPEPTPEPVSEVSEVLKEMREAFNDMKKELTAFNIMNSNLPADSEKTSEDIIANIINPDPSSKKKK